MFQLSSSWPIEVLASPNDYDEYTLLEALISFACWLRWPRDSEFRMHAITTCLAGYFYQKTGSHLMSELKPEMISIISRYISLDRLSKSLSMNGPEFDYFDDYQRVEQKSCSYVCWLFLCLDNPTGNARKAASIGKTFYLMEEGLIGDIPPLGRATFQNYWEQYAHASPFLYVEFMHSEIDWQLNPGDQDFADQVDTILADKESIAHYFRQCRWVIEELRERRKTDVFKKLEFPQFPASLVAEPPELPKVEDKIKVALKSYRK